MKTVKIIKVLALSLLMSQTFFANGMGYIVAGDVVRNAYDDAYNWVTGYVDGVVKDWALERAYEKVAEKFNTAVEALKDFSKSKYGIALGVCSISVVGLIISLKIKRKRQKEQQEEQQKEQQRIWRMSLRNMLEKARRIASECASSKVVQPDIPVPANVSLKLGKAIVQFNYAINSYDKAINGVTSVEKAFDCLQDAVIDEVNMLIETHV